MRGGGGWIQICVKLNLVLSNLGLGLGGPNIKSLSEWTETHFGFGTFEIQCFFFLNRKEIQKWPQTTNCTNAGDQISRSAL